MRGFFALQEMEGDKGKSTFDASHGPHWAVIDEANVSARNRKS